MEFGNKQKIGIQKIDNEHKAIIENVNHLYEIKDHEKTEILKSFDSLLEKLKNHFRSEETFMIEHKSINYISHKLEHDRAYKKYLNYYQSFKSSKNNFDSEILLSMRNWIESHLVKKDMKLSSLLRKN
jgi:hemerythrin